MANHILLALDEIASILEAEYDAPDFRKSELKTKNFDKARYLYIWFAFNEINVPRAVIRDTLSCYKYKKTIYQVIRRMYLRRKNPELLADINAVKHIVKWN
jgi:hypothetical protein